jgi:5'-nucleotidase
MAQQDLNIVLTNDDGIEAAGIQALYNSLSKIGSVTTVAPSVDNSGMGRTLSMGRDAPLTRGATTEQIEFDSDDGSYGVAFRHHELGYEVDGTPADCAIAGGLALDETPDIIVSGCNNGPNAGASVFGRSGTVSAAIEAAHLGIPAIAVSSMSFDFERDKFDIEAAFTRELVEYTMANNVFDTVDYLNVLVPAENLRSVVVTEPARAHDFRAQIDSTTDEFRFTHRYIEWFQNNAELNATAGTDYAALERNHASISPLRLLSGPVQSELLQAFAEQYAERPVTK